MYGTLREFYALDEWLGQLLERPLRRKERVLRTLLIAALHQLHAMDVPPHALVSEHVEAARALGKSWASGLVNALLRRALDAGALPPTVSDEARYGHPRWLIDELGEHWPDERDALLAANLRQAPLTLRVNRRRGTRDDYLVQLAEAGLDARPTRHAGNGVVLDRTVAVEALPGFADGFASVQDEAAQLAAELLAPRAGERILDACAAPGGKTTHLLECADDLDLVALDRDGARLEPLRDNLARLGTSCTVLKADAADTACWSQERRFDRILLDAPCSASGVIRRHPDIRLHRTRADLTALAAEQRRLLEALWPLLELGGRLLYATCSVLPIENEDHILAFAHDHPDAVIEPIQANWGRALAAGRQILPGDDDMDGFYYAMLVRRDVASA